MQGVGTKPAASAPAREAQAHASALSRKLEEAGYDPRHLSVSVTADGDVVLLARLGRAARAAFPTRTSGRRPASSSPSAAGPSATLVRWVIALTFGLALGFLGLPRLELSMPSLPLASSQVSVTPIPGELPPVQVVPTSAVPATDLQPTQSSVTNPHVLFATPLSQPIPNWPDEKDGTAWFQGGQFHMLARDQARFVAVGVPLDKPVGDATINAQLQKLSGPPGGGYGLILRDQTPPIVRDGHSQLGQYVVLEVDDRGDVGIWQRDQTRWIDVLPWTHSEAVRPNYAPNTLTVTTRGTEVRFAVNGSVVADIKYDRLPSAGGVGVFTAGDLNEVALQTLRIETP